MWIVLQFLGKWVICFPGIFGLGHGACLQHVRGNSALVQLHPNGPTRKLSLKRVGAQCGCPRVALSAAPRAAGFFHPGARPSPRGVLSWLLCMWPAEERVSEKDHRCFTGQNLVTGRLGSVFQEKREIDLASTGLISRSQEHNPCRQMSMLPTHSPRLCEHG